MRVLEPASGVLAFYDGRVEGVRLHSGEPNWAGRRRLHAGHRQLRDRRRRRGPGLRHPPHLAHGREIRAALEERGATRLRVLLSHWHLDHVAGNEAFADCEIIAHAWTLEELAARRAAIEDGDARGPAADQPAGAPADDVRGRARAGGRADPPDRAPRADPQPRRGRRRCSTAATGAGRRHAGGHGHVRQRAARARAPPGRARPDALLGRDAVPAVPRRPGADRGRRLRANADRRHVQLHPAAARRARRRRGGCARPARVRADRSWTRAGSPTSPRTRRCTARTWPQSGPCNNGV